MIVLVFVLVLVYDVSAVFVCIVMCNAECYRYHGKLVLSLLVFVSMLLLL